MMTSRQFLAVVGFFLTLVTVSVTRCPAADAQQAAPVTFEGARWIWTAPAPGQAALNFAAGSRFFRFSFALPDKHQFKSAQLLITADNLYTLHVNGQKVGVSDTDPNRWSVPKQFDVMKVLAGGENVIAVEAINTIPGPAGLIVKLVVHLNEGEQIILTSDKSWRCIEKAPPTWEKAGFDDRAWVRAHVIGDYGVAPWRTFGGPGGRGKPGPVTVKRTGATVATPLVPAPADYEWPEGIAFVGDDCSLYRAPRGSGTAYDSLGVTIFNPRHSRAFPEHDLPAPMKVGHKLYAIVPARPGVEPRVIHDAGKGAIGSPSVAFDGKSILVSMVREGDKFFHIYRIPATGGTPEQLTNGHFHDIDPAELPDGRIVFTSTRIGTFEEYHNPPSRSLFVMNADGSKIHPITSTLVFDNEPEVMADGRIIFIRSDNFFDRGKVETLLHAIHPDGTEGYTEFGLDQAPEYGGRLRAFNCGSPAPMPDGRVAFVSGPGITIGMPGHDPRSWKNFGIEAGDVAATPDGRLVCTVATRVTFEYDTGRDKRTFHDFAYQKIGILDPREKDAKVVLLYESAEKPLHTPVFLGARQRPPVLPPRMDLSKADDVRATGLLFCQDARFSRNTTAGWPHVRAIRVLMGKGLTMRSSHSYIVHAGSDVTDLGTVPLAPDGSFAVEVPADMPIAFQAVDAEGRSELNEMSWIYVRPGEKRGCIGCHSPRQASPPDSADTPLAMRGLKPMKLVGQGQPLRFRGNNAAVTGLMELQFDRYREVASINRHTTSHDPLITGAQEVAQLVKQLAGDDEGLKVSSANRLAVYRDRSAAPGLAQALEDSGREVRVAAAMALAACGTRQSTGPLLEALADRDAIVAQAAAVALENITGHARPFNAFAPRVERRAAAEAWKAWLSQTGWDAIEAELVKRTESPDRDVVRRAAVALGHVGSEAGRVALRKYVAATVQQPNPFTEWRQGGKNRGDGTRFNSLSPVNPRTIQAATRSLGYLKDVEAIPLLTQALAKNNAPETGNLFIAEAAVEALGRIATPDAEAALVAGFAQLKDYPRYSEWYGDHGALIACHASPTHYLVAEALDTMGSQKAASIVPQLIKSIPTDTDRALFAENDDVETVVGRVIRRSGSEQVVIDTCLSILGDEKAKRDKEIEQAINTVHGAWGGKPEAEIRSAQILSLVCRDPKQEPRIRAAFDRYRAQTVDIPRVFDRGIPVVQQLPTKHWTCFFLARTMGNLGQAASVDALLAAMSDAPEFATGSPDPLGPGVLFLHNDLTPCWRAATAWALGKIGDKRAIPVLLKVVENLDNSTDTRYSAAQALGRISDPTALSAIQKLAAQYPEVSTRRMLLAVCEQLQNGHASPASSVK